MPKHPIEETADYIVQIASDRTLYEGLNDPTDPDEVRDEVVRRFDRHYSMTIEALKQEGRLEEALGRALAGDLANLAARTMMRLLPFLERPAEDNYRVGNAVFGGLQSIVQKCFLEHAAD